MIYEINISLNGNHFFATHERSITSKTKLMAVLEKLIEKFPSSEGYRIEIQERVSYGKRIELESLVRELAPYTPVDNIVMERVK